MLLNKGLWLVRNTRNYATLKDIQLRLKAIKNIGKITNSMKMIASTKLNRAQKSMEVGRSFSITTQSILQHLKLVDRSDRDYLSTANSGFIGSIENTTNKIILACSSDRGLCGAIHSSVSKVCRRIAASDRSGTKIVVIGEKAKPQVSRDARKNIKLHFNQVGRVIPTFNDATTIWTIIQAMIEENNDATLLLVYNRFVSAISFETIAVTLPSSNLILGSKLLNSYECDRGIISDLAEYLQVCRLYWALVEGHAAEMSSKRTAMENATKNSEAMVASLTMKYNRTRQAVITNELVDIITGASAL